MLYLMLNAAMYLQDVIRLQWEDIKDVNIVTRRRKTGECIRVACLWPETLEALAALERKGDYIFYNYAGKPLGIMGAHKRFTAVKVKAEIKPTVTGSHLRDGAYTAAVKAFVNSDMCKVLVGHRAPGLQDSYVARDATMIAPACNAVRAAYILPLPKETKAA